jgi:PPOX class probable F420-dependent enzyme
VSTVPRAFADPNGELDGRFSSPDASATPWERVQQVLEGADTFWITTVREDGRPHSTPLVAVWFGDAVWFCTGRTEQKARNLERRRNCLVSAGSTEFAGVDVVVEGVAEPITDDARLEPVAARFREKYGAPFNFAVRDHGFAVGDDPPALVFEVRPTKVLAFEKGEQFAQTRWVAQATPR